MALFSCPERGKQISTGAAACLNCGYLPPFQQELEYSCIAACVRMVLAHCGDIRTGADLRLLRVTRPTGIRAALTVSIRTPLHSNVPATSSKIWRAAASRTCSSRSRWSQSSTRRVVQVVNCSGSAIRSHG